MNTRNFMSSLLAFIAMLPACKSTHSSDLSFDHIKDSQTIHHSKIFRKNLRVCIKDQAHQNDLKFGSQKSADLDGKARLKTDVPDSEQALTADLLKSYLSRSLTAWVEPLRVLAEGEDLVSEVTGLTEGCSDDAEANKDLADLSVYIVDHFDNKELKGLYHHPKQFDARAIQISRSANYSHVLHEMGHAFGLGDTYKEKGWGCQLGQPNAVMCLKNGQHEELQPDDILGVQNKFCKVHGSRFAACAEVLQKAQPGMQPNTDKDGRAVYKLGVAMEDVSDTYYEYFIFDLNSEFRPAPIQVATLFSKNGEAEDYLKNHFEKTYGSGHVRVSKNKKNFGAVKITKVAPDSPAADAGLKVGMHLGMIDDKFVTSAEEVIKLMKFVHSPRLQLGVAMYNAPGIGFSQELPLRPPQGFRSILKTAEWYHVWVQLD